MKWLLVWWIIHPGHAQVIHIEKGLDEITCQAKANDLLATGAARARCYRS
jgi:hypothetical protein